MTKDEIMEIALEAGIVPNELVRGRFIYFAELIAEAEREKCALRAEEFLTEPDQEWGGDFWNQAIERVADAIRARGNT